MMTEREFIQVAPFPYELADLVEKLRYRHYLRWTVNLIDDQKRDKDRDGNVVGHGLTLVVLTRGYDTHKPEDGPIYGVYFYFIVPAATYNREAWQRWLFEQLCLVDMHEAMEDFAFEDSDACRHCGSKEEGDHSCPCPLSDENCKEHTHPWMVRPYAPTHGPGDNPYTVHQYASDEQRETGFDDLTNAIVVDARGED